MLTNDFDLDSEHDSIMLLITIIVIIFIALFMILSFLKYFFLSVSVVEISMPFRQGEQFTYYHYQCRQANDDAPIGERQRYHVEETVEDG